MENTSHRQFFKPTNEFIAASRYSSYQFSSQKKIISNQHQLTVQVNQFSQEPLTTNYLGLLEDEGFISSRVIRNGNIIIRLVDKFHIKMPQRTNLQIKAEPPQTIPQKNNTSRKLILSKKILRKLPKQDQGSDQKQRDTKNLVKNIMRIFQSWLDGKKETYSEVHTSLIEMMRNNKFNNSFIIKVSKDQVLRKAFLVFCQANAEEEIRQSKIHDKVSHLEALEQYEKLCLQEDISQQQIEMKEKSDSQKIKVEDEVKLQE